MMNARFANNVIGEAHKADRKSGALATAINSKPPRAKHSHPRPGSVDLTEDLFSIKLLEN